MCLGHGFGPGHGHGPGPGCFTFPGPHPGWGCSGGRLPHCCGPGWRRFLTPAEEAELLSQYLEELKKEMAGVEARIRELRG